MNTKYISFVFLPLFLISSLARNAEGEDTYYSAPVSKFLPNIASSSTDQPTRRSARNWRINSVLRSYAVVIGKGEAFIGCNSGSNQPNQNINNFSSRCSEELIVKAPGGTPVKGKLFVVKPDLSGMSEGVFEFTTTSANGTLESAFIEAKRSYYQYLQSQNIPGGSYFRHVVDTMNKKSLGTNPSTPLPPPGRSRRGFNGGSGSLDDTYAMVSGGRAMSENLQLDRLLAVNSMDAGAVELSTVSGITIREFDWQALTAGANPALDPLSAFIPDDQYVLFFPRFQDLMALVDEANTQASPLLAILEDRSEDNLSQSHYERQLCVGANEFTRIVGPMVVTNVALTGSDPYFRTGTDLALLFETKTPEVITAYFEQKHLAASKELSTAKQAKDTIEGISYFSITSEGRGLSSYVATIDSTVIVSNSYAQLKQIVLTKKKQRAALSSLGEYKYFRNRYTLGDENESGLLIVPDAAIRKWCGPKWRIAASRRTRAAAVISDLHAQHLDRLVKGVAQPEPLPDTNIPSWMGKLSLTNEGVSSEQYGNLKFLTPIAELPLEKASQGEIDAYVRFRDTYQQNWQQYFDPIALRFTVKPEKLQADLTIMPLIVNSEYRTLVDVSSGEELQKHSGDPHPEAIFHFALSLNGQSPLVRQAEGFTTVVAAGVANPLGWIGNYLSLYFDEDPFWDDLNKAKEKEKFFTENYAQTPVALQLAVKDPLKLTVFLTSLRAFANQSAPGLTVWENPTHNGEQYVKVSSATPLPGSQNGPSITPALYYAVTPNSLVITLSEKLIKQALERKKTPPKAPLPIWLGKNLGARVDKRFMTTLHPLINESSRDMMKLSAWRNIPILNELKRKYPEKDPQQLYENIWHTQLYAPGGGTYVWNEQWQTMESSLYGHPAQEKEGPSQALIFSNIAAANFGLSFENSGLRAIVDLSKTAPVQ